jgi:hypothetical protein
MAAGGPKKRLGLDSNLLFDLARGLDFAHDFRLTFQQAGYSLTASPMVFRELGFAALYGTGSHQELAQKAVAHAAGWGILSFSLSSVEDGITERFSLRLREKGLLPEDEVHDGVILAETSLAEIPLLVTSDKHLLDVDENALLLAFQEADLQPVHPVHPKRLLKALR